MAQTANFTPVVLDRDNSLPYLNQTLQTIAAQKQARQLAVQDAMLKQRNINNAIYGDAAKNIREYYDKSKGLPQQDRDLELLTSMEALRRIPADSPEYLKLANQAVNTAATKFTAGNRYFEGVESAIKDMTDKGYKINPDAVRQFANSYMYDYRTEGQDNSRIIEGIKAGVVQLPAGMSKEQAIAEAMANGSRTVKVRKDLSAIRDPAMAITEEVLGHLELYTDRPSVKEAAFNEIDKIYKEARPAGDKLALDPTGTKTVKIGTDYTMSMFDTEEESTDNITGLKYKKPRLNLTKVDGMLYKGGDQADILNEEQFQILINSGKNVQQEVMVGALENIRAHNAEAFRRAGVPNPEQTAMAVSKNNASRFSEVPGFANPFDEGQIEYFQRAAAADLLKQSGRYDKDGYVLGFRLDRGVNKANPNSGVNIYNNMSGKVPSRDAYTDLQNFVLGQKKQKGEKYQYTQVNLTRNPSLILKYAQEQLGSGIKLNVSDIKLIPTDDGRMAIYAAKDIKIPTKGNDMNALLKSLDGGNVLVKGGIGSGSFITYIDPIYFNQLDNSGVSKMEENAAQGKSDLPFQWKK